jgi:hypothetical protein
MDDVLPELVAGFQFYGTTDRGSLLEIAPAEAGLWRLRIFITRGVRLIRADFIGTADEIEAVLKSLDVKMLADVFGAWKRRPYSTDVPCFATACGTITVGGEW